MRGTIAIAALFGLSALSGCITSRGETPEWFAERSAENDAAYPSLRAVPRETTANTDPAHWRAIEGDLAAAGQAVREHPRAEPASAANAVDPAQFLEEAREDLEETRQSHEP
jgi:hypothetical protein